jgi:hypothetical protein
MRNKTLVEDRLDGSSNFSSWKSRPQITLEEDDLLKTLPETTTYEEKEAWKEDDVKSRKIIIYSVRDHLLPRISNLNTTYEMYEALKNMFESNNTLRTLTLKRWLQNIKMTKVDTDATFFMKISEIRDQRLARCHWRNYIRQRTYIDYSQCSSKTLGTISLKYQWQRKTT